VYKVKDVYKVKEKELYYYYKMMIEFIWLSVLGLECSCEASSERSEREIFFCTVLMWVSALFQNSKVSKKTWSPKIMSLLTMKSLLEATKIRPKLRNPYRCLNFIFEIKNYFLLSKQTTNFSSTRSSLRCSLNEFNFIRRKKIILVEHHRTRVSSVDMKQIFPQNFSSSFFKNKT